MEFKTNKQYKAPDGTLYRIEDDGTLTKLHQTNEVESHTPSRYQISDNGDIYYIEDDGSVTYVSNIHFQLNSITTEATSSKRKRKWWIILVLVILLIFLGGCFVFYILINNAKIGEQVSPFTEIEELAPNQEDAEQYLEHASPQITKPVHFYETAEYKSISDDKEIDIIFYPDGVCYQYESDLIGTSWYLGTYELFGDKIHITFKDEPTKIYNYSDEKCWFGKCTMTKCSVNNNKTYFSSAKIFEKFSEDGSNDKIVFFADNTCTYVADNSSIKDGTYYIQEKIINICWDNRDTVKYYNLYKDVCVNNNELYFNKPLPDD